MAVLGQIKKFRIIAAMAVGLASVLIGCTGIINFSRGPGIEPGKPVIVGLLVPSGSESVQQDALANSLVAAARLAIAEMPDVYIDLRVYPTAGNADQAAEAAQTAVADGAKIIVGPLFANAAKAAGQAVASRGISVLNFSNNPDIAGKNIYILGDTFANTADRVIGFAARQRASTGTGLLEKEAAGANTGANTRTNASDTAPDAGADHPVGMSVAALVRADAAGAVAAQAIQSASEQYGAIYVGAAEYELNTESVVAAISTTKALLEETGATTLVLDADAAGALPVFAQLMPENGISSATTQFIGLTRWDKTAKAVRANRGLQGALFVVTDTSSTFAFNRRFANTYGRRPHLLAGKAYDGLRLIGTLIKLGTSDALRPSNLTRDAGFVGANGVFRLRRDGTNQRALAVATLREGQVVVIEPAPRSFGGAGS